MDSSAGTRRRHRPPRQKIDEQRRIIPLQLLLRLLGLHHVRRLAAEFSYLPSVGELRGDYDEQEEEGDAPVKSSHRYKTN